MVVPKVVPLAEGEAVKNDEEKKDADEGKLDKMKSVDEFVAEADAEDTEADKLKALATDFNAVSAKSTAKSKSAKKRANAKAAAAAAKDADEGLPEQATHMEVIAARDIKAGEEICVSYMPSDVLEAPSLEERVNWGRSVFGFNCGCARCSGKDSKGGKSKSNSRQTLQIASYKHAI